MAERLGRNARFAAIGTAIGAVLMGACGTWVSTRAVFWLAALLCVPALLALRVVGGHGRRTGGTRLRSGRSGRPTAPVHEAVRGVLLDRRLMAYVACTMLFHLSNAAMLPLAAVEITKRADARCQPDHRRLHPGAAVAGGVAVAVGRAGGGAVGAAERAAW